MTHKGLSGGDRTWIIYEGPDGDKFWLSGTPKRGLQGVELARGIVGLDRPPTELVWLQEAHQNGADLVGSNVDVRKIKGAVNILGKTPRATRDAFARWQRANAFERLGKLWFINSYSGIRHASVLLGEAPNGSLDMDPAMLRRFKDYPWTWVAPNPYFKGTNESFEWEVGPADSMGVSRGEIAIRNLGDADCYPIIELPGPGQWVIPRGIRFPNAQGEEDRGDFDMEHTVTLPPIEAGQKIVLNPDPKVETIDLVYSTGIERNLWAQMNGQRPKIKLLGDRSEKWEFAVRGGRPGTKARVFVTPLYSTFM